jgi:NRPS condensation-like uncharacterized protein
MGDNLCSATLSNVAFVSESPIKFGEKTVTDAYIIPPAVRAPGLLLLVSTYNGVLTLSLGYYKGSMHKRDAKGLLNKIRSILIENCILAGDIK